MDKTERGKLLRERGRKRVIPRCVGVNPLCQPTGKPFVNSISFTVGQHAKELPVFAWLRDEDPKRDQLVPQALRIARKSPLTRLVERWGEQKLAVVPLER
jgi:hypothetical protein